MMEPHTKVDLTNGNRYAQNHSTFLYYFIFIFFPEAFYASVKKIHFCMGLNHSKVGFTRLIHVAPIAVTALKPASAICTAARCYTPLRCVCVCVCTRARVLLTARAAVAFSNTIGFCHLVSPCRTAIATIYERCCQMTKYRWYG